MTADHLEKRNHLKDLSADAQILVKMGKVDTVNEGIKIFYANLGHTELKTFGKWKESGFQVMKSGIHDMNMGNLYMLTAKFALNLGFFKG